MKEYAWRPGRKYRANPNEAQKIFVKLKSTVGLTAYTVLEEARKKHSPLHRDFEWDDGLAAEEYRLGQARKLVRAIVIVGESVDPRDAENVWVHTTKTDGSGEYERPSVVVRNPDLLASAIHEARQYLDAGERRWSQLREVSRGFAAARKAFDDEVDS
jgi:hypothetical protein